MLIEELEQVRERAKEYARGIGEPAVSIDPAWLLVNAKDPMRITMRMEHLIELVRETLKS